eukprot:TCONS_00067151-protein
MNINNLTSPNFRTHHFVDLRAGRPARFNHVARARAIHQARNSAKNTVVFIEDEGQLQDLFQEIQTGIKQLAQFPSTANAVADKKANLLSNKQFLCITTNQDGSIDKALGRQRVYLGFTANSVLNHLAMTVN